MSVEILQNDSSVSHQRTVVAKALPELEAFIIIGRRSESSGMPRNFASCSFSANELANAVANFILANPKSLNPFCVGLSAALDYLTKNGKG